MTIKAITAVCDKHGKSRHVRSINTNDWACETCMSENDQPDTTVNRIVRFDGNYAFLSNFYPSMVGLEWFYRDEHPNIAYPTVEHAFQAAKSDNPDWRHQISLLPTPGNAKRAGRMVELRPDWDEVKYEVMNGLVRYKFAKTELARLLLATGEAELIEGNWWGDVIWGAVKVGGEWKGQNELGKILMETRRELRV